MNELTPEQEDDIRRRTAAMLERAKVAEKMREILLASRLGRPDESGRVTIIGPK